MQLCKTEEAIETYHMALVLNPSLVDAHSNLGNLYKATGQILYWRDVVASFVQIYIRPRELV